MDFEQYVAVYSHDNVKRCLMTLFELVSLAHRPHGSLIEQIDPLTFRLRVADPVWDRIMLPISQQKKRLVATRAGTHYEPPSIEERDRQCGIPAYRPVAAIGSSPQAKPSRNRTAHSPSPRRSSSAKHTARSAERTGSTRVNPRKRISKR